MSSSPERDETDIYGDLPNFQFDEAFKKLEEEKSELQNKVEELGTQLDVMKIQNDKLAAKVKSLGKNISCLYKTAQRELERKEQIIADLRKERDDLLFRRGLKEDKLSNRRRPSRKQLTPTKKVSNGNLKRIQEAKVKNGGSSPITLISLDSEDPERKDYDKNEPKEMKIPEISNEPSNVNVDHNLRKEDTSNTNVSTEKIVQEEAVSSVEKRDISATPANDTEKEKPLCTESAVKTPAVTPIKEEKFTVHMSSEDCGFGQRRRIRRVLKSSATVTVAAQASTAPKAETITSATPKAWNITSAEEKGVKRPLECWKKLDMIEMEPIVIKRSRLDYNVPPRHHDDKAVETSNVSNSADIIGVKNVSEVCMKNSDDNSLETENVALPVENCSSVCNKNSNSSLSDQNVDMEKDPRKEDSHLPKIDDNERAQDLLKKYGTSFGVSAYPNDNQDSGVENSASGDVRNPSCQDEIKSTPLSKHYKINSESKNRTFSNNEGCNSSKLTKYLSDRLEDNRSKDNFSNASPSSSSPSHSCQSEHRHASPIIPQNEKPSGDGNFKRSRSWERERVSYCDLNDFSDTDRKGRHSERDGKLGDAGREGYKRDVYRGKFSSRDRNRDSGRSGNSDRGRDIDSGDHDRGRENNRIREVDRRRDHNRDRELVRGRNIDRGKDSNRLRDSDRDRDCDRNRDLDRVRESNRGRDQGRDRDYDRGQDADRSWNADHGRDIDRGRNRSRDRDRSKELERSRDGDQSRDRDRSRERDRDRSRERDRDRSRERDRDRSRERDRDRSRERDRDRSRERDRDRSRERDRDRSRERERGRDQIRYRDQHRIRVNEKRDASDSSRKYSNEPRDADTTDRKTKGVSGGSRGGRGNWNGYRDRDRPQNEAEDTTEKWCEKRNMNQDKLKSRTQELSSSDNTPANDKSPNNPVEPPEWD